MRRLQAALRLANEEVAQAQLALGKAKEALSHARAIRFSTPAFRPSIHLRVADAIRAADRQLPLRRCVGGDLRSRP